jgi:hypothetical protein
VNGLGLYTGANLCFGGSEFEFVEGGFEVLKSRFGIILGMVYCY